MARREIEDPATEGWHARFILDWIEISDSMDLDSVGEFRFLFRIRSDCRGLLRDTPLPEEGTIDISSDPARNHLGPLDLVLYDGPVEAGEAITLEVTGEEVDRFSRNEPLEWYERSLDGNPGDWAGTYTPWDEGEADRRDPEHRAQWRMSYRVEISPVAAPLDASSSRVTA